jgi:hypothetical protein
MATPGNFGGGSTGLGQIFLGITRAPPSAPGEGAPRALCGETRTPRPQSTRQPRERLAVEFPIPASNRRLVSVCIALSEVSFTAPHLILGRSSPVGIVEGRSD